MLIVIVYDARDCLFIIDFVLCTPALNRITLGFHSTSGACDPCMVLSSAIGFGFEQAPRVFLSLASPCICYVVILEGDPRGAYSAHSSMRVKALYHVSNLQVLFCTSVLFSPSIPTILHKSALSALLEFPEPLLLITIKGSYFVIRIFDQSHLVYLKADSHYNYQQDTWTLCRLSPLSYYPKCSTRRLSALFPCVQL